MTHQSAYIAIVLLFVGSILPGASQVRHKDHPALYDAAYHALCKRQTGNALIDAYQQKPPFHIKVTTIDGRDRYIEGQRIQFVFESDRSCYITVLTVDPSGDAMVLVPNENTRRDFKSEYVYLRAGDRITVPPTEEGRERGFPVIPPHGESLVKVIATLDPLSMEELSAAGESVYESLGGMGGERMKSISRAFSRMKAIGRESVISDEDNGGHSARPAIRPGAYTTAELYILTGEDEADLNRRETEREGRAGRPPDAQPPVEYEPAPPPESWPSPPPRREPMEPPVSEEPPAERVVEDWPYEEWPPIDDDWEEEGPWPAPSPPGGEYPSVPALPPPSSGDDQPLPGLPPLPDLPPVPGWPPPMDGWPPLPGWPPQIPGWPPDLPSLPTGPGPSPHPPHVEPAPPSGRTGDANNAILNEWQLVTGRMGRMNRYVARSFKSLDADPGVSELLVFYEPGKAPGMKSLKRDPWLGDMQIVKVKPDGTKSLDPKSIDQRITELKKQPGVVAVIRNVPVYSAGVQPPPLMHMQWALKNKFNTGMDTSWHKVVDQATRITPPLIGVVDQGLNLDDARLRAMVWTNPQEIPGNRFDDDNNGLVDDVHGYNFILNNNCIYNSREEFNHGSFCSSIIAGRNTGSRGDVIGMAPRATIIPAASLGPAGGNMQSVLAGIAYVASHGARVINLSLGAKVESCEVAEFNRLPLFDKLEEDGIILVIAAGNDHLDIDRVSFFPACLTRSNAITVLATDANGELGRVCDTGAPEHSRRWDIFSNYGRQHVHIGAPGSLILGIPRADALDLNFGTSFAAPMVTGVVGLIQGQHPDWNHQTVIRAVLDTARPVQQLQGKCRTGGILDVEAALNWRP